METEYQEQAKVFKALCDPKRLAILEQLRGGEKCACVFAGAIEFNTVRPLLPHENSLRFWYCCQPTGRKMDTLPIERFWQRKGGRVTKEINNS